MVEKYNEEEISTCKDGLIDFITLVAQARW